ncbi:MAG: mechanosensitive ion channel family protein [Candidatus Acidiferrales bacterium]
MFEALTIRDALGALALVAGALLVVWLVSYGVTRAIRRYADRLEEENRGRAHEIERWAQQFIRFARRTIEAITATLALWFLFRRLGLGGVEQLDWADALAWVARTGLRILLIIIGAYFLSRLLHFLIARLPFLTAPAEGPLAQRLEREKRVTTVSNTLGWVTTVVVMSIAALIILREFEVDITPILTGGAIIGVAVGFGAQHLVRDVIAGFFLILEDQVRVGDVAVINGKGGLVEAIRLRTIVLRDFDGTVHIIPNGAITELSNRTKDYSYYVIELGVAYKEDVDRVMSTLREVGNGLETDPEFRDWVLEPLEVVGVDAFADSAVILKMRIKTVPRQQWAVGRELRRRIKKAFDERGIEIPYPHLSVYFGEASKPVSVRLDEETARNAAETAPGRRASD